MSLRRVIVVVAAALVLALGACGSTTDDQVSYEFTLTSCYAAQTSGPAVEVSGIITVTNHGSNPFVFEHPCVPPGVDNGVGYEATDLSGSIISQRQATDVGVAACACSCEKETLAPGQSTYVHVADIGWYLTTPDDPRDIDASGPVPTHWVSPGTYQMVALLLNGARTNAVSLTVCAATTSIVEPYAECLSPCATESLADTLGMGPVRCDSTRQCSDL